MAEIIRFEDIKKKQEDDMIKAGRVFTLLLSNFATSRNNIVGYHKEMDVYCNISWSLKKLLEEYGIKPEIAVRILLNN